MMWLAAVSCSTADVFKVNKIKDASVCYHSLYNANSNSC
jgi:hypothetical protein